LLFDLGHDLGDVGFDRRRIRLLTIVDNFTRESLTIDVAVSIGGQWVAEVLSRLDQQRGRPNGKRVSVTETLKNCRFGPNCQKTCSQNPGRASLKVAPMSDT
jgi:hypothetical protein